MNMTSFLKSFSWTNSEDLLFCIFSSTILIIQAEQLLQKDLLVFLGTPISILYVAHHDTYCNAKKSNNIDNNIMIILWQPVVTEHIVCARNYIKKSLALSSSHLILTKTSWSFAFFFPMKRLS